MLKIIFKSCFLTLYVLPRKTIFSIVNLYQYLKRLLKARALQCSNIAYLVLFSQQVFIVEGAKADLVKHPDGTDI